MRRLICLYFWLAGACFAQDTARMDQVVQYYVASNQFMGTVLVARGSDVLFSKGYGSANLEWQIANTPTTKFRLGSVTKQFTAAAILLLEERGKLKIDDPVKMYMPDAPAAWDMVTIRHVLTHTAGIPNFTDFPDFAKLKPFPQSPEQLVALFRDKPLEFAPGEKWNYSNSGYVLLGYLIEKVSGQSYERFIQENIFTPLGMKDSGYESNAAVIPHRASGYTGIGGVTVNADFLHTSISFAAGGLYSTTEDLLRWNLALYGGKLLSPASLQRMITPDKMNYALGLRIANPHARKSIGHGGAIEGFNTRIGYYPDSKVTVIALSNLNSPALEEIAQKLGDLAHGDKVTLLSETKEVAVAAQSLAEKTGVYQLGPEFNFVVKPEGDHLLAKLGCQRWLPYFAESESLFFTKVVEAKLEFSKDDSGKVTHLVLHQNGRDQKAPRISDQLPPETVHNEIPVSAKLMAEYVGKYEVRPGLEITISLDGDHLFTQVTGQGKAQLFTESDTKFFTKDPEVLGEFVRNDKGAVAEMVGTQCGRDFRARRL